jgi:signal transduction histidine kinase
MFFAVVPVILGACILFVSLIRYVGALRQFQELTQTKRLFSSWIFSVSLVLIVMFLAGYIAIGVWFTVTPTDVVHFLVAGIFFFGSVFVLIMVGVAKQMFKTLAEKEYLRIIKEQSVREKEQADLAKDLAQKASIAKSDFLSRMSHEMRTPMNAIVGMASIGKAAEAVDRKNYCFQQIESASEFLLGVVNDILSISKIESGKFELALAPFEIRRMIDKLSDVINFRVQLKHQRLTIQFDELIPSVIILDEQRLYQVLMNILGNAIKFTPENGFVTFQVQLLKKEGNNCTLRFTVTDSGIGIQAEAIDTLFNAYQQADHTIAQRFGGTGLGLAISKEIVEMMGGTIQVSSKLGEGACFSFEVTVQYEGAPEEAVPCKVEDASFARRDCYRGIRLLLVDDIDINREIISTLLEPTGIEIDEAVNGLEAIELFSQSPHRYDLILMDVQMPELDGLAATVAIRALDTPRAKDIPIIAMTANVFKEDRDLCREAGMNQHVGKPIDLDELVEKMNAFIKPQF